MDALDAHHSYLETISSHLTAPLLDGAQVPNNVPIICGDDPQALDGTNAVGAAQVVQNLPLGAVPVQIHQFRIGPPHQFRDDLPALP